MGRLPGESRSCGRVTGCLALLVLLLRIGIGWHFSYEAFNKLAGPAKWTAAGYLKNAQGPLKEQFTNIAENPTILRVADAAMSYGMLVLGLLFMLGALTRISGACLIVMLAMFYLAQPPWTGVKLPAEEGNYLFVNKNLIELLAVAVVAASGVSRVWGIDALFRRKATIAADDPGRQAATLPRGIVA